MSTAILQGFLESVRACANAYVKAIAERGGAEASAALRSLCELCLEINQQKRELSDDELILAIEGLSAIQREFNDYQAIAQGLGTHIHFLRQHQEFLGRERKRLAMAPS